MIVTKFFLTFSYFIYLKKITGYWLKDPSDSDSTLRHVVDYRTERYRLDDLLLIKDTVTTGGVRSV